MNYLLFVLFLPLNFLLLSKTMPHKKKFFWYEYVGLFILPVFVVAALSYVHGRIIWTLFFIWLIAGPFFEALVGFTHLFLTGKHLWVYEKLPLFRRTTSYLSAPFWALAGTVFYAVERFISQVLK